MRSRILFALASLLTGSVAFAQTTWYVDASATPPGNGTLATPYADLQFALAQSSTVSGDTLLVAPGTYFGGFDFLGKDVVVQSTAGAATTVLDGGAIWPPPVPPSVDPTPRVSVVRFTSGEGPGAVLDGFTVRHGRGSPAPSATGRGGGVLVTNSSPTLRRLVVLENLCSLGAGMYFQNSASHVSECEILNNGTDTFGLPMNGSGLYTLTALTVERCTFADNGAAPHYPAAAGGGAWAIGGTFTDCVFRHNFGFNGGGAQGSGGTTFTRCRFELNEAQSVDGTLGRGAGVFGGTLFDCVLEFNSNASIGGGAVNASLTRCILRGNAALTRTSDSTPGGGAGAADSTLVDCEVHENVAGAPGTVPLPGHGFATNGGGLRGGMATRTRIHDNVAYASGDPIAPNGKGGAGTYFTTLVDCEVYDNQLLQILVPFGPGAGGGVFGGTATRCRIWGNTAPFGAGAANAVLESCTVAENNAALSGGGIAAVYNGSASVRNGILWGDSLPETAVISGSLTIEWSTVDGGFPGTGNINNEPLFQSAPNHDYHLLAGSPCIDAGDPALLDPNGSRIDMGAFPFECEAHTYCVGKVNSLGCIPTAGFTGTAAYSGPDNFHVTGVNIRKNALGMLLWSRSSNSAPFFNATLCVGQPFFRAGIQNSGGTGVGPNCTGSYDFYFSNAYMNSRGILPFETIFAQWYMRDATHPDGTSVGVSDAVSFTVCP